MRNSKFLSLLSFLILAGCATTPQIQTVPIIQKDIPVSIPQAQPLELDSVNWQVLTVADLKELLAKATKNHEDLVLFSLDADNYKNLSLNMDSIMGYIKQQQRIIDFLKNVIQSRSSVAQTPNTKK